MSRKLNEESDGITPVFTCMAIPCTFVMKYGLQFGVSSRSARIYARIYVTSRVASQYSVAVKKHLGETVGY